MIRLVYLFILISLSERNFEVIYKDGYCDDQTDVIERGGKTYQLPSILLALHNYVLYFFYLLIVTLRPYITVLGHYYTDCCIRAKIKLPSILFFNLFRNKRLSAFVETFAESKPKMTEPF